ncbi:MAG: hypothetical protein ACR2PL_02100 [Dehalococcoidia bacterium]
MALDPGQSLTRDLIAADPDGALEQIERLAQRANSAEDLVAELQSRLQERDLAMAESERRAAEASGENESLRGQLVDGDSQRTTLLTGQGEALAAYREMVLAREPALPPELIRGGSLHELNESVQAARNLVAHVQSNLAAANTASRMPAGAPMRSFGLDIASMSATEKLIHGVRMARGEEMAG